MADDYSPGLEGVIAFETEIAEPDKDGGALRYRGVDIEDLVGAVTFGNVWALLVDVVPALSLIAARRRQPATPALSIAASAIIWGGWTLLLFLVVLAGSGGNVSIDFPGGAVGLAILGALAGGVFEVISPELGRSSPTRKRISSVGLVVLGGVLISAVLLGVR